MINHIRTLLLNIDGSRASDTAFPGEEFVPPDFKPVSLPQPLITVRNVLFGVNPDRAMMNYRLRQYMTLIHSTELEEFTTEFDKRVTYWPSSDETLFNVTVTPIAQQVNEPAREFYFIGSVNDLFEPSKLLSRWKVEVTDASNVTIQTLTEPTATTVAAYTLTDGLSSTIQLPGSPLKFRFQGGVGSIWFVQSVAKPTLSLAEVVVHLENCNEINSSTFFGDFSAEPYKTFYNLWNSHRELPYRLGGIILTLAYRTNELIGS